MTMAVAVAANAQNILTNSLSHRHFSVKKCTHGDSLRNLSWSLQISSKNGGDPLCFKILGPSQIEYSRNDSWRLRVFESNRTAQREDLGKLNLDSLLSICEVLCLAPSAVLSIGYSLYWMIPSFRNSLQVSLVNRVLLWQIALLAGSVAIAALIRHRQWRKICRNSFFGASSFNFMERIEKLEEDMRSSATVIRVMSRQLEKLGIRFRVTRKALKGPITEAAALAQKNSETTRALAVQEDILEKELGEIQKVLLAMQEQQQKQFELILAMGKALRPRESKHETD